MLSSQCFSPVYHCFCRYILSRFLSTPQGYHEYSQETRITPRPVVPRQLGRSGKVRPADGGKDEVSCTIPRELGRSSKVRSADGGKDEVSCSTGRLGEGSRRLEGVGGRQETYLRGTRP